VSNQGNSDPDALIQGSLSDPSAAVTLRRVVELAQAHLGLERVCAVEFTPAGPRHCGCAAADPSQLCGSAAPAQTDGLAWVSLTLSSGEPFGRLFYSAVERGAESVARAFMAMLAELVRPELDHLRARDQLRESIQGLIASDDVALALQPIFDLRNATCLGVEVLARFPAPFPPPDRMFLRAEHVGLGLELEELVVVRAWPLLEQLPPGLFLALNLTPPAVLALARRAQRRPEIDLSSIVVEVTEHRAIDTYGEMRHELEQLRGRGLRLAVDDAGAGYASLRHVLELRPDLLKVDRSLIDGLAGDPARQAAVSSFVALARDLHALVVAEGVETNEDLDAARALGLDAAQGYLLGRPSTDRELLTGWLSRRRTPEHV
jgi:EAL domain-containing protein (putative c-di-GMP-specific phosphodiesterase class I)